MQKDIPLEGLDVLTRIKIPLSSSLHTLTKGFTPSEPKTNAPIVVGLDPMLGYIPEHIKRKVFAEEGETLSGAAEAVWQYNRRIIVGIYDGSSTALMAISVASIFVKPEQEFSLHTASHSK